MDKYSLLDFLEVGTSAMYSSLRAVPARAYAQRVIGAVARMWHAPITYVTQLHSVITSEHCSFG